MEPACIRHTEIPGTSKLFADYSYQFDNVARFYRHNPHDPAGYDAAAREIRYPDDRRAAMARALAAQNGAHPLLERFSQPGTVAVVTGQQVGLFSGPSYTIYKALTAAKLAEQLSARGIPAVPIFWLATEDHDFPEVNHAWVFDESRRPVRLEIAAEDYPKRQQPVGAFAPARMPVGELRSALRGFPHGEEVAETVAEAYCSGATLGGAFRRLLVALLGKVGVLTLDPLDPAVRAIGAPFMREALKAAPGLKSALLDRSRELEAAGYHAQVLVEPGTSTFFLLENGERVSLRRKDTELAALQDRATDVSPNALLRPVWQDYLLPTVACVGGPGELAYFAQSQVVYNQLLGRMPVMAPRTGFTLLDARATNMLERYRTGVADVFVQEEALRERIAHMLVPQQLERSFTDTAAEISARLEKLCAETTLFDPTLAAALNKSRAKILYQVDKIRRKTEREALRRDARATSDAQHLCHLLYPQRHLQERFYSFLPFAAQYGMDLAERLYEMVDVACPDHRVVTM